MRTVSNTAVASIHQPLTLTCLHHALTHVEDALQVTYDGTLSKPLRLKTPTATPVASDTKARVATALEQLAALVSPFEMHFLRAKLSSQAMTGPTLSGGHLVDMMTKITLCPNFFSALDGHDLEIMAKMRLSPGAGDAVEIDARLDLRHRVDDTLDNSVREALRTCSELCARSWSQCAIGIIGPWAAGSGVSELRLRGRLTAGVCDNGPTQTGPVV